MRINYTSECMFENSKLWMNIHSQMTKVLALHKIQNIYKWLITNVLLLHYNAYAGRTSAFERLFEMKQLVDVLFERDREKKTRDHNQNVIWSTTLGITSTGRPYSSSIGKNKSEKEEEKKESNRNAHRKIKLDFIS